jgi:hypothetical protein
MGGNALASHGSKRVSREVAEQVTSQVTALLSSIAAAHSLPFDCRLVPAYRTKPDFGDLDFVVDARFMDGIPRPRLIAALSEALGAEVPAHAGGPVFSFGYPLPEGGCLQVDLIRTPTEEMQAAIDYFSWNDLGNLIGRIAHKMGLKYGHNGLWMVLRDGTHQFASVLISRDTREILEFLGYSYLQWVQGFDNREEIYRFAASTRFFNKAIYALENRNHIARTREKKRPVYMEFLAWLENPPVPLAAFEFPECKADNLPRLFAAFPEARERYEAKWAELEELKNLKSRYNAGVVTAITGLEHEALGRFMSRFKVDFAHVLRDIRSLTDAELHEIIQEAHSSALAQNVVNDHAQDS